MPLRRNVHRFVGASLHACACAIALVAASGSTTSAAEIPMPAPSTAACPETVGDAVALQVDGETPVIAGRDGALARFEIAFDASGTTAHLVRPPQIRCTPSRNVVGIAIDAHGNAFVAEPDRVRVYPRDGAIERNDFTPLLAAGETIAAIALFANGSVELAIAKAPSSVGRFLVYGADANGASPATRRSFSDDKLLAAPSGITIDGEGRTYVYDDAGEVLIFDANVSGAATPLHRLYGPTVGLWPRAAGTVSGSRQLALDESGYLYAQDDGIIVNLPISDSISPAGNVYACDPGALSIARGLATGSGVVYALTIDPSSKAAALRIAFNGGGSTGPCVDARSTIVTIPVP